jgi:hypothetical protein
MRVGTLIYGRAMGLIWRGRVDVLGIEKIINSFFVKKVDFVHRKLNRNLVIRLLCYGNSK